MKRGQYVFLVPSDISARGVEELGGGFQGDAFAGEQDQRHDDKDHHGERVRIG